MALQFGEEQFSRPSTHLLISVYIVYQQSQKVLNMLEIDLEMPITQLS